MEAYPLQWPLGWEREQKPKRSHFGRGNEKPSIAYARDLLIEEVRRLTGTKQDIILSSNLKLKNDGLPYSAQKEPQDPGIAIYFMRNGESMAIACDAFDKVGCNIYACYLTIQAMRGIDRWGCSELLNRIFTGFKALPQAQPKKQWWNILGFDSHNVTREQVIEAYKNLAKKLHPDAGGTHEMFVELQDAYQEALIKTTK